MNQVLEQFAKIGIVPVIALEDAADAVPLAKALIDGGLPCAEVTFRTEAAEESIRLMHDAYPDMLVGAGTVLTTEQVDKAMAAGASFIVSPGFNPKVVNYCVERNIPITPGCSNPSDIEAALEVGLEVVKFFPAEASGGLPMIKAMAAPYTKIKFMPTGGINAKNITDYLNFKRVIACGGSWMVDKKLVAAKNWDEITRLTAEAVNTMLGLRVGHIGINENSEQAAKSAQMFAKLLGVPVAEGEKSYFVSPEVEVMKNIGMGTMGHIAIDTNNIERAVYHLSRRGFEFDETTAKHDAEGNLTFLYLKGEIGGFAVHLKLK